MSVDAHQYILYVGDWIDLARFTSGDERVQAGEALARLDIADEQEIFPAESHHAERALARVVVDRHIDVVDKPQ